MITGKLVDYDGEPIARRTLSYNSKSAGHGSTVTDGDGTFEQRVSADSTYRLGFYKYKYGPKYDEPNGVPHVCSLGEFSVQGGETDLGTVSVPRAHLVEVRTLDADGDPVGNAKADLNAQGEAGDYWGTGPGTMRTNNDGYVVVDGGAYSGIELAGSVELTVSIPNGDGGSTQYSKTIYVDEPLSMVAQTGEGMTVARPGETPTATTETTARSTTTARKSGTAESTTAGRDDGATNRSTSDEPRRVAEDADAVASRGFFSNDASGDELELLSDPFTLTVGGFVLSAGGIAHQLIRGN